MNPENSAPTTLKEKISHELIEWLWIFAYLALFFCVFATYKMLILQQLSVQYFEYGTAIVNALVLSKVILIGEYVGVGRRQEHRPMVLTVLYKAFLFAVLVAAAHLLEEGIRLAVHGNDLAGIVRELKGQRWSETFVRIVLVFSVFIPFFGFVEIRRRLGEKRFSDLLFQAADLLPTRE